MKKIHVPASTEYDIYIDSGLLKAAAVMIKALGKVNACVIVSDDNVFPLYGGALKEALKKEKIRICEFVFPHGENSKSLDVYEELLEKLCMEHLTRDDIIIALGGGVTGDMAGFAASTYQRGIRYVQIPTTLLAAVDSSVGGKTAVNLKAGKNQAGSFYQPSMVICDTDVLYTLPEKEFINGCAEVIKYGMIKDEVLLCDLEQNDIREDISNIIARCVEMKRDVVQRDEFDRGERMLLNFGHTFGHGVEKCSGYNVPHGFAVAMGMAVITKMAEYNGICENGTYNRLINILDKYNLPYKIEYPKEKIIEAAFSDKKSSGNRIKLIVPYKAGECGIIEVKKDELEKWI